MDIALVCPYSLDVPGGVGTHVLGLAEWLAGQGHRPAVIAPGRTAVPVADGVAVELLGPATAWRFNGSVANLALRPAQSRRARALVRDADVVHVHEPLTPGIAHAAARAARHLVVTHHADFTVPWPARAVLRLRAAALGERVTIAVSETAAATARAVTCREPRVLPNAITLPPAPSRRRSPGLARIGFLGRLDEPRKGFPVFRELAELAAASGLPAEFVAAGPGRAVPGPVDLLGAVADRQQFLGGLDLLVAPNLGGESFGLVLIEALAAGCDVVASDLPAFTAVLAEAGVGATFPTGDADALLAVVRSRLDSPPEATALHAAVQRWGWDEVGPGVLAAYAEARGHRLGFPP